MIEIALAILAVGYLYIGEQYSSLPALIAGGALTFIVLVEYLRGVW